MRVLVTGLDENANPIRIGSLTLIEREVVADPLDSPVLQTIMRTGMPWKLGRPGTLNSEWLAGLSHYYLGSRIVCSKVKP